MTIMHVVKNGEGKLVGASEKDSKAFAKFRRDIETLEPGEILQIDYWFARNRKLHGWHFIVLTAVFNHQEQYADSKAFRKWIEAGAGFCDYAPGPKGKMIAIPRSIAWDELDDVEFKEHHEAVMEFLRSRYCTNFLWPHLPDHEQANMMDGILQEAEDKRQRIRQQRALGIREERKQRRLAA